MTPEKFTQQTLNDIKVKLEEKFIENFTNKAFFDEKWKNTKFPNTRGSLMLRSGNLRNSIISKIQGNSIIFSSSMPYADIHNNGGEIKVTPQMKKYFWAMYYKTAKAVGSTKNKERTQRLSAETERFKALALKPIGSIIKIEKRQFIGHHNEVDKWCQFYIDKNMNEYFKGIEYTIQKK